MIQLLFGDCQNMLYEIPLEEKFVGFVEYKSLDDTGLVSENLSVDAASQFPYLTQSRST